jgi:uncharacterized protein YoxC
MKINYTLVAFIVLLVWSVGATYLGYKFYQNFSRVSDNQELLLRQVDGLKKDKQLVLTPKEFRHSLDSTTRAIMNDVGIKVRHVEQLVQATSHVGGTISFIPRDTLINRHDTLIGATTFSHNEEYISMKGIVLKDSASVTWKSWDKINLLLYWKREGNFIPWLFGKKVYSADLRGKNPYMTYEVDKNIKVQRK